MDDFRSVKALFWARIRRTLCSSPSGSFSCYFGLKPLKCFSFLAPRVLPAGQFTVYKKSRPDSAIPDSAKNLILFSHLETQGACSNLPR